MDANSSGNTLGIGERLLRARETMGLSTAQVAEKLRCDGFTIDALEQENFATLGASIFVRGHLGRYAELVNESPAELLAIYGQSMLSPGNMPDLKQISQVERQANPNRLLRPALVVVAGLAVALIIFAVLQRPRATDPPVPAAVPAAEPSLAPTVMSPVPAATASEPPVSNIVPSIAGSAAAAPVEDLSLSVLARKDCWTEVYDADGKQLYFDTAKQGSSRVVTGRAPLRIVLGNADGVTLALGGNPVVIPLALKRQGTAFVRLLADGKVESAK